jgi:RND family efflux transporter MFP subunit/putative MATE family efflux protein
MATQLEETVRVGGSGSCTVALTPQARRLLEGPVLATLLRLAAPTVGLMLLQAVIAAGEAAFVGRLGSHALAGVSLSFPLVMLMTTLAAGAYGGAVASGVARALGAGRSDDAARLTGTALGISPLLGVAWTAAMLPFGRTFYTALRANGQALEAAVQYSNVFFLGAGPFWVSSAAASVLRGGGNATYPAAAGAAGGLLTLAVLPLVIFGAGPVPRLGIAGAAWAAAAYNMAMAIVLLRAVWAPGSPTKPSLGSLVPRWRYASEILRVAVPSAANTLLTNLTFVVLTALVAPFGAEAIAGYGAGGRLEYLLIPVVFGVGSALVPLVAASDGAGDLARVRRLTHAGAALGAVGCGLVGGTAALFPGAWMGLFTSDPAVAGFGEAYLVGVGPAYAFLGLGLALYFAAQGRGRTVQPLLATLIRLLVAGVLGALGLGVLGWGIDALFSLMACGLVLYGMVMVAVMCRELGLYAGGRCAMRFVLIALCVGLAGCVRAPSAAPEAAPIPVTVSRPVEREVTDYADFTGRTAAVDSVEVRARVWGYLDRVNFKEGALVKKGDVLFEIDPRLYRADFERARGAVAQFEARVYRLDRDYRRTKNLLARGAVGREEYDRYEADYREALANLDVAKANRDVAALNLDYTRVIAPVNGRVSRYVVTVGNLIQSGDQNGGTLLTTVVSVDPMYVYFDMDERTVLRVRQLIREGKASSASETAWPVWLGLATDEGFPHPGAINFEDNQVNPKTGTLRVRGVFPSKDELLSPGLFARVRVPIGRAHRSLLVTDRAIDTDQGQKVVYVVTEKNEVVSRAVRLGALHDGLREITGGLEAGERVIVSGLQQVRPGLSVEPKPVDMPNGSQKSALRGQSQKPAVNGLFPLDNRRAAVHRSRVPITADLHGGVIPGRNQPHPG